MSGQANSRSKYGNRKVQLDGYTFDSQAEARRYGELRLLERAGEIRDLVVHRRWGFVLNECLVGHYESDFDYTDAAGRYVVEDVKGVRTQLYALKWRLMYAQYGIRITEIEA